MLRSRPLAHSLDREGAVCEASKPTPRAADPMRWFLRFAASFRRCLHESIRGGNEERRSERSKVNAPAAEPLSATIVEKKLANPAAKVASRALSPSLDNVPDLAVSISCFFQKQDMRGVGRFLIESIRFRS